MFQDKRLLMAIRVKGPMLLPEETENVSIKIKWIKCLSD